MLASTKFWGVNKVNYGQCGSGEYPEGMSLLSWAYLNAVFTLLDLKSSLCALIFLSTFSVRFRSF